MELLRLILLGGLVMVGFQLNRYSMLFQQLLRLQLLLLLMGTLIASTIAQVATIPSFLLLDVVPDFATRCCYSYYYDCNHYYC